MPDSLADESGGWVAIRRRICLVGLEPTAMSWAFDPSLMSRGENAVRSRVSVLLLIAGVLVLLFGVFLAYEAQDITVPSVVDFLVGVVLIAISNAV
ncbi:MAG: hypothetical protein L3K05_05050 [Thermoplasmata archaeon]|nr:hypothetical protein [Thermoplasmata archaeon]